MTGDSRSRRRVRLAVTMGDAAGIGPEVTLKALGAAAVRAAIDPVLVGDLDVWRDTAERLGRRVRFCLDPGPPGALRVAPVWSIPPALRQPGPPRSRRAAAACGEAAFRAILEAVRLVQAGSVDGMVTAPISKAHVVAAGHDFPGHTELLAELAGGVPVRMMMAGPRLRVVLVTTHVAIAEVSRRITREAVAETIAITAAGLRDRFGIAAPRLAVTGLNPHAGEGGIFGDEEGRAIAPAVRAARRRRLDVVGPLAADGVFAHVASGAYDAVITMYHDQGLGPFKLMHFADGVNMTLGLPFVRTSPDHGTAFDIAGTGKADPCSMIAALLMAAAAARAVAARHSNRPRRGAHQ